MKKPTSDRALIAEKLNAGYVLQWCCGTRTNGWWWLRETPNSGETIKVHTLTARSVAKNMQCAESTWRRRTYTPHARTEN